MADGNINAGGPFVGRDVSSGNDFVGRDKYVLHPESLSQDDKLNTIFRYLLGDPLSGIVGQVEQMRQLGDRIEKLEESMREAWQREAPKDERINNRFTLVFFLSGLAIVLAVLADVIALVLLLGGQ